MNYEKKYKEAQKWIESIYSELSHEQQMEAEAFFPELKESEDERIRKELIEHVKDQQSSFISAPDCRDKYEEEENNKYNAWLDWLEKQEGCECIKKDWLEHIKQSWYKEGFIDGKYSDGTSKEWTKNDAATLKELIDFLENGTAKLQHDLTRYANWLKIQLTPIKKQGEPTDINPSKFDLRLNKLLKQFETLPKEELANSLSFYLNVVQNDGTYKPDEKQDEQPSAIRWYDVSLIPQEMEELLVEWDSEDATWHEIAFYHADTKTFWNCRRQVENVTRWAYIDDLLEKQGEQKPADKTEPFDKYEGLTDFERTLADICTGWIGEEIGWKEYIKDNANVLLKIAIKKFNSVQDASFEQKSAWSEEDEHRINRISDFIWKNRKGDTDEIYQQEQDVNWLKSLKNKVQPQPKHEWSEEDKKMIGRIRSIVEKYAFSQSAVDVNGDLCEKEYIDTDNWLKSLKDRVRPKQEWSKEDETKMRAALAFSKSEFPKEGNEEIMEDTIEWLKSIKERIGGNV